MAGSIKKRKNIHTPFPARATSFSDALNDAHLSLEPAEVHLHHALEISLLQLFWKGAKELVHRYILLVRNIQPSDPMSKGRQSSKSILLLKCCPEQKSCLTDSCLSFTSSLEQEWPKFVENVHKIMKLQNLSCSGKHPKEFVKQL